MFKDICFISFFILIGSVLVCFGQEERVTATERYNFSLVPPAQSEQVKSASSIMEFRGNEQEYGAKAVFFLKRVIPLGVSPLEKVETFMQDSKTIEDFDSQLIGAMKQSFPDAKSIEKGFIRLSGKPAIEGTFSFTARGTLMKGCYVLLLLEEQSSLYAFSWSGSENLFDKWNAASQKSAASLKTN